MDDIMKDDRFSHISRDPRFKMIPRREKKVKIDKRFDLMFKDKNFKINYTIDKRGRPLVGTSSEDLKKYYDLSSDEDEDDDSEGEKDKEEDDDEDKEDEEKESVITSSRDYARGEVMLTDSSSDEDSSEVGTDDEAELDHGWGELDRDAECTNEITNRLALCHMDWDRIRAMDLMVLFNSFLPQGGHIRSISIYPSEFGLQRMKEEEIKGPTELVNGSNASNAKNGSDDEDENEEGNDYTMEKLRQYQLNRLKYYYAVLVFDSPETANKIYTECDGLEYESSATRLDLRFIPDDTTFDQEPREVCDKMPDISKYKPRFFITTALQQAKVDLTWDETNPERNELNQKLMSGQVDGISEADLRDYLATSSEDEADDENEAQDVDDNDSKDDPISKYRSLLQEIEEQEEKKKSSDVGLEITWGVGLKNKAEKLVKEKLKEKNDNLTPFEQFVKKQKEKKKEKKLEKKKKNLQDSEVSQEEFSDDDIPSDIDMNDPYFQEEFHGEFKKKDKNNKKKNNKKDNDIGEESKQEQAELELLLMNDAEEKNHFSLKSIQNQESEGKKKRKKKILKKNIVSENKTDDFEMNVKDDRFSALYSSHHFNIDPTDSHYRKTKGMEALRAEKISRKHVIKTTDEVVPAKVQKLDKTHRDPELSVLVKSIKRKTQHKNSR